MRGMIAAIVCFAFAVLLLLFPQTDFAHWVDQQINHLLAPGRLDLQLWEWRGGIFFAVIGAGICIYKWRNS